MHRFLIILFSLSALASAEIAAWKVDIDSLTYVGDPFEDKPTLPTDLKLINKPPEASVFFRKGDVLKTFSKEQIAQHLSTKPTIEWAVWNETTKQLVTKSDHLAFIQLEHRFDAPGLRNIRTTLSCYSVTDPKKGPDENAKPMLQASALSWSGGKTSLEIKKNDHFLKVDFETTISENSDYIRVHNMKASIKPTGPVQYNLSNSVIIPAGETLWIARDYDGTTGIDICISSQIEFIDGSPYESYIQIDEDGKAINAGKAKPKGALKLPITKTHTLASAGTFPNEIATFYLQTISDEEPPWMEDPRIKITESDLERIPKTMAPKAIQGWYPNPVWDLNALMRKTGFTIKDGEFTGYDPKTHNVFLYSRDKKQIEMFDMLFSIHSCGPAQILSTWEHSGQTRLISTSGGKATLERYSKEREPLRTFEVEPTMGANDQTINLRLSTHEWKDGQETFSLMCTMTCLRGQWKKVTETEGPKGKQTSRIKLERIDIHEH